MAQAISNKVQSTNPTAGLLGLTPKPKAPPSVFGGAQTSTPSMIKPVNMNLPKPQMVPNLNSQIQSQPPQQIKTQATSSPVRGVISPTQSSINPQIATPQTPVTPNPNTFPGIVGNLVSSTQQAQPVTNQAVTGLIGPASTSPKAQDFTQQVASYGQGNIDIGNQAAQIAADYGRRISDVGQQGARGSGGYSTTGTSPVAEGNAGVIARNTAAIQSALAAGGNMALQGTAQRLTGQNQAASAANQAASQSYTGLGYQQAGLNSAASLAQGQQTITQSGLQQAGSLTQPYPTAYGQTSFDPGTGQFGQGGDGSLPSGVMQQYAQMAATGQYAAIPSFITSNPVLNAQLNVAAKAFNPKYTPVGAQGASQVLGNIPAMESANTAAEGIKNTIVSYLQANPQLNPNALAVSNQLQQWVQGKQLTDPKYQTLFNYLDEYTNTLAPILGVGGNPTNLKTQIAQGFINAAASGQSITEVLNAMSNLATNKIQDLQSGAVGGGTSVPAPSTGGGLGGGFAEHW